MESDEFLVEGVEGVLLRERRERDFEGHEVIRFKCLISGCGSGGRSEDFVEAFGCRKVVFRAQILLTIISPDLARFRNSYWVCVP